VGNYDAVVVPTATVPTNYPNENRNFIHFSSTDSVLRCNMAMNCKSISFFLFFCMFFFVLFFFGGGQTCNKKTKEKKV